MTAGSTTRNAAEAVRWHVCAEGLALQKAAAQRILHPYTLEVKEIAWWSVYEIGQRLCDRYDDTPESPSPDFFPRT